MIICIEYWKGDTYLMGTRISKQELKRQLHSVETRRDHQEDNFVALLCRMYGWKPVDESIPDCTYDRDAGLIF